MSEAVLPVVRALTGASFHGSDLPPLLVPMSVLVFFMPEPATFRTARMTGGVTRKLIVKRSKEAGFVLGMATDPCSGLGGNYNTWPSCIHSNPDWGVVVEPRVSRQAAVLLVRPVGIVLPRERFWLLDLHTPSFSPPGQISGPGTQR